ncbi:P27 family phage terminase small subunit [Brevibacillus choshinensis]|uniref:P27 family phage terminase small subunit n=1 Tax=Brevibacillus choshinensis TaxID=54911 RepID=UPI002E21A086|nr:P27 family phage terminase small subunit [Brevibacillus choshinensis]
MAEKTEKEKIKSKTISEMKKLGVYKKEYNRVIEIYAELVAQYDKLNREFEDGGYAFEVDTVQGGRKKAPIVATLETLRKDILAYSDRLCLNPKAIETVTTEKKGKSALASALASLE